MAITIPTYCSREDLKSSLDLDETARNNAQVDRAIEAATHAVEGVLHRKFYPQNATRYFDWPNYQYARSWRLWLDHNEVISVSSLTVAGTSIPSSGYFLEPVNSGPPYNRIEMDLSTNYSFESGNTEQRAVAVTGVFGYTHTHQNVALLAEALDGTETGVDVTNGASIGVGDLIEVDDEHMICVEKSMLDTTQNLQTPLTAVNNNVTVAVSSGSTFNVGEVILLDSERMLIVDIASNNLTVKRAWDGSVLAAHTGSDIYALRSLTVVRGANGSTAATHSDAATVEKVVVPPLIRELAIAEATTYLAGESSAYTRTNAGDSNNPEDIGRGVQGLRNLAVRRYGRKSRVRTI
jgi:hypothetical protein